VTSKALQPIVCCLGDDVGGNPTQFVLERALVDCNLSDWKLFTAEVQNSQLQEALKAFELLAFEGVLLVTDKMRHEVLQNIGVVMPDAEALWCGRATLLRRCPAADLSFSDKYENDSATDQKQGPQTAPYWSAHYSAGTAIQQALMASNGQTASVANYVIAGDSPVARSFIAAMLSQEQSVLWWVIEDADSPWEKECPSELLESLKQAMQNEKLLIRSTFPEDFSIHFSTLVFCAENLHRSVEKWLLREHSPETIRMVDASSDLFGVSFLPGNLPNKAQLIGQADWLAKMLEEDFLRLTGIAPNPAIVRDALDEYLEL